MKRTISDVNKRIAFEILQTLPENKMESLRKALSRNFILTSCRTMSLGKVTVYKEGWYVQLFGTRCNFNVFAYDNDGEFVIANRKPNESKLNKLYDCTIYPWEGDYDFVN